MKHYQSFNKKDGIMGVNDLIIRKNHNNRMDVLLTPQLTQLTTLVKLISDYLKKYHINRKCIHKIQIAVDEVVTNIIKYGYNQQQDKNIQLYVKVFKHIIRIVVKDRAKYFNPLEHKMPNLEKHKDEKRKNGLGIYMTVRSMDEMKHRYNKGNTLIMKIYKDK